MEDVYELKESEVRDGVLVDIYEHRRTGDTMEKEVAEKEESQQ